MPSASAAWWSVISSGAGRTARSLAIKRSIDRYQYAGLLAGCLLATAPLELLGARVYRRPRRLVRALLPPFVLFVTWDVVATARDTWSFNPRYVTGTRVLGLPLEELAFFVVIPICALLTYEGVQVVARRLRRG